MAEKTFSRKEAKRVWSNALHRDTHAKRPGIAELVSARAIIIVHPKTAAGMRAAGLWTDDMAESEKMETGYTPKEEG